MSSVASRAPLVAYRSASTFVDRFRALVAWAGGREKILGHSCEGRPIFGFELGREDSDVQTVLLTSLVHGIEVIGAIALQALIPRIAGSSLGDRARFVVVPVVNPDAFADNIARVESGRIAWRRCNARGVDLNRNFPFVGASRPTHPFAGSRIALSPHYAGPAEASEPETRALMELAAAIRPDLSIGFHSFGELLLHPWAHTDAPPPRKAEYRRLGDVFADSVTSRRYAVKQASAFYPTIGDLDDWLDATFDCLSFTVEVGALDRRLVDPRRLFNPFWWMNPTRVDETVDDVVPGVLALLEAAISRAPTFRSVA